MEQLFGYEQVMKRIANIHLTFVLLLWCLAVLMERGTPEEGGIGLGGDVVGDAFEVS